MHRLLLVPALLATAAVSGATNAAAEQRCQPFQVISTGEFRETTEVDVDADGRLSVGDRVIGHRALVDANGDRVGDRFFVGVFEAVDADGKELSRTTSVINAFTDGAIFAQKQKVNGEDLATTITGGTGVFTGAQGFEVVVSEGIRNTYTFELSCDGEPRS